MHRLLPFTAHSLFSDRESRTLVVQRPDLSTEAYFLKASAVFAVEIFKVLPNYSLKVLPLSIWAKSTVSFFISELRNRI
jgi:hypothetical protein